MIYTYILLKSNDYSYKPVYFLESMEVDRKIEITT